VSSFGCGGVHVAPIDRKIADAYPSVRVTLDLSERPWTESRIADVVIHIGTVRDSSWWLISWHETRVGCAQARLIFVAAAFPLTRVTCWSTRACACAKTMRT